MGYLKIKNVPISLSHNPQLEKRFDIFMEQVMMPENLWSINWRIIVVPLYKFDWSSDGDCLTHPIVNSKVAQELEEPSLSLIFGHLTPIRVQGYINPSSRTHLWIRLLDSF